MARKLGWLLVLMLAAVSASAAAVPGSISGYVKNSAGVPQMGVAVEVAPQGTTSPTTVFTDARGYYKATELQPGAYEVKASSPSYLPTLRENLALQAGANLIVNLTLTTLFEAVQWLPPRRGSAQDQDDWKWTLRSVASRPILRMIDDRVPQKAKERTLKAHVAFVAGSENEGFGSAADMSTQFRLEQSLFSAGTLSLGGDVGYSGGPPAAVIRAAYSHALEDGSHPQVALTMRHFATPETVQHDAALDALALTVSDGFTVADFIDLDVGGDLQAVQFRGRVTAFRPFGVVAIHLSPNTVLRYRYATSEPNTRAAKGFDSAPADLSESGPRMSMVNDRPMLEHARHHEISISRRFGNNSVQLAGYSDHVSQAALVGVGDVTADSGAFLPDVYSGTFTYNGGELSTQGVRVVAERRVLPNITATVDYGYGGVIAVASSPVPVTWQEAQSMMHVERRHAVGFKVTGDVPHCKTRWITSYKWTSGPALTAVDMFNASPGETDPYLSVFVRQPLPGSFLTGHMEAMLDVRNLLAQGYIPVLAQDGQTLYLVQSSRSVRGGLAFTF